MLNSKIKNETAYRYNLIFVYFSYVENRVSIFGMMTPKISGNVLLRYFWCLLHMHFWQSRRPIILEKIHERITSEQNTKKLLYTYELL